MATGTTLTINGTSGSPVTISDNAASRAGGGLEDWSLDTNTNTLTFVNFTGNTVGLDNGMFTANGDFVADPLEIVGGGGIFAEDGAGSVVINEGTIISGNYATGAQGSGGGILMATGTTLTINGTSGSPVTISDNAASRAGGGLEDWSLDTNTNTLTFVNFTGNTVGLDNGMFTANGGPGNGGAIHVSGPGINTITGGSAAMNLAASEGGGFWNNLGTMTVDGVTLTDNDAQGAEASNGGGALFNNGGTLIVQNGVVISNNTATGTSGSGGGIQGVDGGSVTVSDSEITGNTSNRAGGGIEMAAGNLILTNSDVSANNAGTAPGNGGGVHLGGAATAAISTSTFRDNVAVEGGGLWNSGSDMTVMTSEISGNSASEGGGVYNETGGTTSVMTSTISANTASVSGGGVSNNGDSLEINASTIATNDSAGTGGGIDAVTNVSLKNTIVALNTATSGTDVSGNLSSNDYNLIGTDDLNVFTALANDLEEVDPMAGPLQDNGGTTFTHQLLDGSPAFDAGDSADTFMDQIGQDIFGAARDIGAYESQVTLSINNFNDNNVSSIYPNPTRGAFNIEIGNTISEDITLKVIDINGRLVKESALGNGLNSVNISGMNSGLYILNITSGGNTVTHKLILK